MKPTNESKKSAQPSADEIMQAMRESGYLMEQDVATQLEKRGLHVRTVRRQHLCLRCPSSDALAQTGVLIRGEFCSPLG